jgi:YggT family protein
MNAGLFVTGSPRQAIDQTVRIVALVAFGLALLVLLTSWAVRRQLIGAFGWWPRFVRSWSDPVLRPLERRVHGAGGNPQDAPLWLLGVTAVAALLLMAAVRWVFGTIGLLDAMRGADWRSWLELAIVVVSSILSVAILVRIIGSWLGAGRYRPWMRPVYLITDWLIEPIRRRLPAFGPIDVSPFLAYLIVVLLKSALLGLLARTG